MNWNICTWSFLFLSGPGLAWQAYLKKTGVKLELLTNNDMLMMVKNKN